MDQEIKNNIHRLIASHAIHILLENDESLLCFLFHHKKTELRLPVIELKLEANSLNFVDRLLIQAAIDLWDGSGSTSLGYLILELDDQKFIKLLQALSYKRQLIEVWEAIQCCE